MMSTHVRRVAIASIASVALAFSLSACAGASGSSDNAEIVVGATGPVTGPNAAINVLLEGAAARFDELNAAGGINGHKVKFVVKDDQYNPAQTPQQVSQLVEDEGANMICALVGTGPYAAVNDYLGSKGILGVPASGSAKLLNDHTYEILAPYGPLGARLVGYAVDTLKQTKIAIAYSADDVGQPFRDGAVDELTRLGITPVAEIKFDATATDFSAQAAQLKQSGADFVLINHVPTVVAQVQNAATKIGYTPNWGAGFPAASSQLVDLAPEAAAKTYFAYPFLLADSSEASAFQNAMKTYSPNTDTSGVYPIEGYTMADGCVEVLRKAVDLAGGGSPSKEQILQAAAGLTINTDYVKDLTWTTDDHSGQKTSQIVAVKNGQFVSVDGFK